MVFLNPSSQWKSSQYVEHTPTKSIALLQRQFVIMYLFIQGHIPLPITEIACTEKQRNIQSFILTQLDQFQSKKLSSCGRQNYMGYCYVFQRPLLGNF